MKAYDPKKIEKKWQIFWEKKKIHQASDSSKKKKYYCLVEFPYPSGDGLHVGHARSYTALDVVARKRRMEGFNVLYPMGWDAFGLPAENYAIKTKIHPSITTKKNIANFKKQMKSMGISFDWSREINTTDPKYYKWTQWIFLQLLKHNLAYKARIPINWCPKDKIGLANEEVVDGKCERCGTEVEKREKEQWMLAITKYAERLDKDLDTVDYLPKIKLQQRNWIGKSEGAEIDFPVLSEDEKITVFTTRPDTIFGATYVVVSPEHALIEKLRSKIKNISEVEKYINFAKDKTEIERTAEKKEKTGVLLEGVQAINPATKETIPVWVADYVLGNYGTGALMAVPAHDERDFEFAEKYKLPVREVVVPNIIDERNPPVSGKKFAPRRNVHPIVRDPKTGNYLALKWKKFPWITFPMGGIDDGEDVVTAARREVREETGFTNLKLIKVIPGTVRAEYFAAHKDENRIAYTIAVVFDLIDHTQEVIDEKEKETHEIIWLPRSEINYKKMTHAEVDIWNERIDSNSQVYSGHGRLINTGAHGTQFEGKDSQSAMRDIATTFGGKWVTKYKLRDWVFSRQRYWGEPIPVIHCEKCGVVPVPEKDLPVKLPNVKNYEPTDTGESPLATISSWVNTKCPSCKGRAKRETDVMPNWAGSSWYFLRFADPKNSKAFADKNKIKKWLPVDWYNGGMEHTTLHLLYSRFWNKFLYDLKLVPHAEPYAKRTSHGLILAQGGEKMSKSKGNVVNPDEIISKYGADTLRLYEMFIGPFDQSAAWSTDGIVGPLRFLEKVWRLADLVPLKKSKDKNEALESFLHKTIDKVSRDIDSMSFNTAVSTLMIFVNECEKHNQIPKDVFVNFLKILAPFAPHLADEVWSSLGNRNSIHQELWPKVDIKKIASQKVTVAIQVNGKTRATLEIHAGISQEEFKREAMKLPEVQKWLQGKAIRKEIYVPGRIFNLVLD